MDGFLKEKLAKLVNQEIRWNCMLREYSSFHIGGPAAALAIVEETGELQQLVTFLLENQIDYRVIGKGTNLLIRDHGYAGVAIILQGEFKRYSVERDGDDILINAGAGFGLTRLAKECAMKGYSGLEFAMGIPGTIGGAAMMNAGAWGGEFSDVLEKITFLTPKGYVTYDKDLLSFCYRKMILPEDAKGAVVTSVDLKLFKQDVKKVQDLCKYYSEQRLVKQPVGYANAGSIFKNPSGDSAGRLIDCCGLKGHCIGDAEVSEKHANFIINKGKATADDVLGLIKYIQKRVMAESGIQLETEVHIL